MGCWLIMYETLTTALQKQTLPHIWLSTSLTRFRLNVKIISLAKVAFITKLLYCIALHCTGVEDIEILRDIVLSVHWKKTPSGMHLNKNMEENGVLPGTVCFKWLWLCEASCSAVWSVERAQLIMIGYQTKLSGPLFVSLFLFFSFASVLTAMTVGRLLYSLSTSSFIRKTTPAIIQGKLLAFVW